MENIFHKKDRKQYFHSQDNFYSTTLNSEKKNKKKRNIKNTKKNNLK
jgi:DNA-binding transcriptional regulator GbsR (MarR family)